MNSVHKITLSLVAGMAFPAWAAEPNIKGHSLPSEAQISAFIEHDRQLVTQRKAPAELVGVDTEIGKYLREARAAATQNDMAKIKAIDPEVRALLDRRKILIGTEAAAQAAPPANGDPKYAQMLKWDENAVARGAVDPVILQYDAQMAGLQPESPEYKRLEQLKLAADQKLEGAVMEQAEKAGLPNPCINPMGRNTCPPPPPVDTAGPALAARQQQQDADYRRQQEINGNLPQ